MAFKAESPVLYVLTFGLAFAVLLFDLALPLGVAAGVPYVALVLLGLRARWRPYIFVLAAVATVLTVVGYLYSPPGGVGWIVLTNRGLALFAIWVSAVLLYRYREMAALASHAEALEHKKTELALDEKSTLLETTFENMSQGFAVFDAAFKLVAYNQHFLDLSLFPPGFIHIGTTWEDVLQFNAGLKSRDHQGGEEEFVRTRLQRVRDGECFSQHEQPGPNGSIIEFNRNPMPDGGFVVTYMDITERKRAEDEVHKLNKGLEEKSTLLEASLENMSQGIVVYDADLKMLAFNTKYIEFMDLPKELVWVGAPLEDIVRFQAERGYYGPGDVEDHVREREKSRRSGTAGAQLERTMPNGTVVFARREPMPHGGYVTTYTDITERKRVEDQVRQLNESLEEKVEERTKELQAAQGELLKSERLATLGRLTGTVSHELRNPLGVIRTSFYLVRNSLKDLDPRIERAADRVERGITRCDRIIEELLDFTRGSELKLDTTLIDDWLAELLDELTVPEGVGIIRDLAAPGITVALDSDRLRRAVINLYENACQAMTGEGGKGGAAEERQLTIRTGLKHDRVEIRFQDGGPGIPDDVLPMIFEPLFSTKGFGVGLGLSVVKQIIDQHGGGIEVATEDGQGTEMCLWLPLAMPAAQAKTPQAEQSAA